jgi:hypothetical protein
MQTEEQNLVRRLADYQRTSGILWIVLGAVQVCLVVTALAGAWNIYAGITRMKASKRILERDPAIPGEFESIAQLVIIGVINLVLGGFIGVLFVGFDFYIRDKVLTNAHIFTGAVQPSGSTSPSLVPVPVVAGGFDQHLRALAKLRDDGVITEEDFGRKKKEILGL